MFELRGYLYCLGESGDFVCLPIILKTLAQAAIRTAKHRPQHVSQRCFEKHKIATIRFSINYFLFRKKWIWWHFIFTITRPAFPHAFVQVMWFRDCTYMHVACKAYHQHNCTYFCSLGLYTGRKRRVQSARKANETSGGAQDKPSQCSSHRTEPEIEVGNVVAVDLPQYEEWP